MKKVMAIVAVASFALFATPALADVNSSYIKIETSNSGSIQNYTSAKAETGGNWAGGSDAGKGGSGGDVENEGGGDYNNGDASAGDGGDGGDSGLGGTVDTGDANADAASLNSLNTTEVKLSVHGDMNSSKLKIETDNTPCGCEDDNSIQNATKARARTGGNNADGSDAGRGGSGGDVESDGGDYNNGGADAGNGGDGGWSDDGGFVTTGVATANAGAVNILNATLVRVRI